MNKFHKLVNFVGYLCILWNSCQGIAITPTVLELPSSETCLSCMCTIISNCNRTVGCSENNYCGIFQIDSLYWTNGGEHTVDGKISRKPDVDFVNCANDENCAKKTVISYLTNFSEDCNEDAVIDCEDHAAAHLYSNERSCKRSLPKDFRSQLQDCVYQLNGNKGTNRIIPTKTPKRSAAEIVNEKCEEYTKFAHGPINSKLECDKYTEIKNYTEYDQKQLPYMATIGYGPINDIAWQCDSALISEQYVITGAACARYEKLNAFAKWVHFGGSANDKSIKDESTKLDLYEIVDRFIHPEYEHGPKHTFNDVALFKLNRKVEFSEFIRPICLSTTPVNRALFPKAFTIGWSETASSTKRNYLPVVVPILDFSKCAAAYGDSAEYFPKGGLSSAKLTCVGNSAIDTGACVEITGSALVRGKEDEPCMWVHVGIPAFGSFPCPKNSSLPFLYTNISPHLGWIQSIVWPQK